MSAPRDSRWPLALLLSAFLALATFYNVANPIFEANDEPWHFRFVRHLADGKGLPILQEDPDKNVAGQEGGQPPLYYVVTALATFWMDAGDLDFYSIASPFLQGVGEGPNYFVHTPREDFPYRRTALAVHLTRGLSTLLSAATVLLTYLIALEFTKGSRRLALSAAVLTAFNPQFLFTSASVSNDNLITVLSALILLLIVRSLNRGASLPGTLMLGAALAAALLSKASGLGLLPLALAGLVLRAWNERSPAPLKACLILFPIVAAGSGWWFVRNQVVYGDPLGLSTFVKALAAHRPDLTLGYFLDEAGRVWTSYWALFGWSNVPAAPPYYFFYGAISLLGVVGAIRLASRAVGRAGWGYVVSPAAAPAVVLFLWGATYVALVFQYASIVNGMQGRLLFPALPAISLLTVVGLSALLPRRWPERLPEALGPVLAALAFLVPLLYILPAYPRAGLMDESQVGDIPHRLDVSYGDSIQLMGYRLEKAYLAQGDPLEVTLFWRALSPPGRNYTVFLHAFDPGGNPLGDVDGVLGRKGYPTAAWQTGDALEETYSIPLAESLDRPSYVRVEVGLYRYPSMARLQASDPLGRPLGTSISVFRVKAPGPQTTPPALGKEVPLGDRVLLIGYQVPERPVGPGQTIGGRLWWKALAQPPKDYTVFVQLLGPGGLLAQYDAQPRANAYPTSLWEAGEIVEDSFRLTIPQETPPGAYRLIAGMYDAATGERLKSGTVDFLSPGELTIGAAP